MWLINGSQLNVDIFPTDIVTIATALPDGGRVFTLTIGGLLKHNQTSIQCQARLMNGSSAVTPMVSFLIQGK